MIVLNNVYFLHKFKNRLAKMRKPSKRVMNKSVFDKECAQTNLYQVQSLGNKNAISNICCKTFEMVNGMASIKTGINYRKTQ